MSAHDMILYFGSLTFRSAGVLAVGAFACAAFRSPARRHAIWFAATVIMLAMPLADAVLPSAFLPDSLRQPAVPAMRIVVTSDPGPQGVVTAAATPTITEEPTTSVHSTLDVLWSVAFILYTCIAAGMLLRLAVGYRKLSLLRRTSSIVSAAEFVEARHSKDLPEVREAASVLVPVTIGLLHPAVILPADWRIWDAWKRRAVLAHERAHVHRHDWVIATIAAVNKSLFWFNPLAWWLERNLCVLAEECADEASLHLTGDAPQYASLLLQFAASIRQGTRLRSGGIPMAKKNIQSRIERVLALQTPGTGIMPKASWFLVGVLATPVLYGASAVHIRPAATLEQRVLSAGLPAPVSFLASEAPVIFSAIPAIQTRASESVSAATVSTPEQVVPSQPPRINLKVVQQTDPEYSEQAKQARLQGVVNLLVTVGPDGHVISAETLNGHPLFLQAALNAVRQWVFEIPIVEGKPGTAVANVMVNFRLPPAAQQASAAPPPPASQNANEPRVVNRVMPVYSPLAAQARLQGTVTLTVQVGNDGAVTAIQMISGHPLLQQSSVDAIRQWRFDVPVTSGNSPFTTTVAFNYRFVNGNPTVELLANAPPQGSYQMTRLPDGTISTSSVPGVTPPLFRAGRVVVSGASGTGVSDENLASTLQRCAGCTEAFVEGINGVIGTRLSATFASSESNYRWPGVPSVIFHLASNGTDLEVNCAWHEECTVTSTFANGTSSVQTLGKDQSAVVSASAQIAVTYRN